MTAPETKEAPELVKVGVKSTVELARRLGLTWELRPATVSARSSPDQITATYDGDTEAINMIDLTGGQMIGERAMGLFVPPAGNFLIGGRAGGRKQIAFTQRTTTSTAASAAQGVLRLDSIPLYVGNRYEIYTSTLAMFSSVAGDTGSVRFSFTTDGSNAGTGSPLMSLWNSAAIATVANGQGCQLRVLYTPTANVLLSVLLFTIRLTGTGNITLFSSPATLPTQLMIDDLGPAITDTGTII
jgi:hypothetical protein